MKHSRRLSLHGERSEGTSPPIMLREQEQRPVPRLLPTLLRKMRQPRSSGGGEIEVEITDDRPTAAERKAVEDFFDWLLAEALRSAREVDKAA